MVNLAGKIYQSHGSVMGMQCLIQRDAKFALEMTRSDFGEWEFEAEMDVARRDSKKPQRMNTTILQHCRVV